MALTKEYAMSDASLSTKRQEDAVVVARLFEYKKCSRVRRCKRRDHRLISGAPMKDCV